MSAVPGESNRLKQEHPVERGRSGSALPLLQARQPARCTLAAITTAVLPGVRPQSAAAAGTGTRRRQCWQGKDESLDVSS